MQGISGQSCTSAALCHRQLSQVYSDFIYLLVISFDLRNSSNLPDYNNCSRTNCGIIDQGSPTNPADPKDGGALFYSSGGTCNAVPDGYFRRFCPCLLSSIGTVVSTPAPSSPAVPTSQPSVSIYCVSYTGSYQTFHVPIGVTSITVYAYGAQGSDSSIGSGVGEFSGYIEYTVSVTPNTYLYIYVGGTWRL